MKRAIVLGGGGSRGGYHIGVWKALRELGIDYQMVTGTSVGALNGAIMAQNDFESAVKMWENLTTCDVLDTETDVAAAKPGEEMQSFAKFLIESLKKGGADFSPLAETIARVVDEDLCRASDIDFGLVTVRYPSMKPLLLWKEDIPKGKLFDYMLASAACFPAFRVQKIGEEQFVDGSYYDVMPVNMALDRGADEVIAVTLDGIGISRKVNATGKKITVIGSNRDLGNFLVFDGERAKRLIRLGYLDTMRKFGRYEGGSYTFELGELFKNTLAMSNTFNRAADLLLPRDGKLSPSLLSAGKRFVESLKKYGSLTRGVTIKRILSDRNLMASCAVPMMAEACGDIFGADELKIHRFSDFNAEIYRSYTAEKETAPKRSDIMQMLSDRENFAKNIARLRAAGGKTVVYFFKEMLEVAFVSGAKADIWLAASIFPKDFYAAAYLCLLDRTADFTTTPVFNSETAES